MAGYKGYSMSNNAVDAYMSGEKPISKWTKQEVIECVEELRLDIKDELKKLRKDELFDLVLRRSSWHHTSQYYNETDFYKIDEEAIENITAEKISEKIANRVPINKTEQLKEQYVLADYTVFEGKKPINKSQYGIVKGDWFTSIDGDKKNIFGRWFKCRSNYEKKEFDALVIAEKERKAELEQLQKKKKNEKQEKERLLKHKRILFDAFQCENENYSSFVRKKKEIETAEGRFKNFVNMRKKQLYDKWIGKDNDVAKTGIAWLQFPEEKFVQDWRYRSYIDDMINKAIKQHKYFNGEKWLLKDDKFRENKEIKQVTSKEMTTDFLNKLTPAEKDYLKTLTSYELCHFGSNGEIDKKIKEKSSLSWNDLRRVLPILVKWKEKK